MATNNGRASRPRSTFRNWCFTLNNYTPEEEILIQSKVPDEISYVAYSHEQGKEGTPHLQGYLQMKKECMCQDNSVTRVSVLLDICNRCDYVYGLYLNDSIDVNVQLGQDLVDFYTSANK